jgi:hypothetical protein
MAQGSTSRRHNFLVTYNSKEPVSTGMINERSNSLGASSWGFRLSLKGFNGFLHFPQRKTIKWVKDTITREYNYVDAQVDIEFMEGDSYSYYHNIKGLFTSFPAAYSSQSPPSRGRRGENGLAAEPSPKSELKAAETSKSHIRKRKTCVLKQLLSSKSSKQCSSDEINEPCTSKHCDISLGDGVVGAEGASATVPTLLRTVLPLRQVRPGEEAGEARSSQHIRIVRPAAPPTKRARGAKRKIPKEEPAFNRDSLNLAEELRGFMPERRREIMEQSRGRMADFDHMDDEFFNEPSSPREPPSGLASLAPVIAAEPDFRGAAEAERAPKAARGAAEAARGPLVTRIWIFKDDVSDQGSRRKRRAPEEELHEAESSEPADVFDIENSSDIPRHEGPVSEYGRSSTSSVTWV